MKRKTEPKRPAITRRDFIGAQMANLLNNLAQRASDRGGLEAHIRAEAIELVEKWDAVAVIHLNNPITLANIRANYETLEP